ncbi:LPXTG cell wall anchor domain-containing protein [Fructilactobacillus myrtifloralis]|uniref:LPXTG cell wall anchor domain-containing protein n=1 Tax=Fructilactobacillus myrtifloralis TaxID=2940301 RepID=A0ABY5BLI7_9LACO|nr:LPXTG cell wall anchor domain-containing protein [Fructilactobacillus myrtifloralis]USS84538.1 LPXTG cell wall anchor domain-containing protein [Fructilactobacillus myrtifloralis]
MSASTSQSNSASESASTSFPNHESHSNHGNHNGQHHNNGHATKQQKLPQTGSDQQNLTLLGLLTMFLAGLGLKRRKRDEK